jgi:hypothetical protein
MRAHYPPGPRQQGNAACLHARKVSRRVYMASLAIFGVGFFFAFVAPLLGL